MKTSPVLMTSALRKKTVESPPVYAEG